MRLTSLTIENFKSIASLSLTDFHRLDVFIGKNNSGKSNILDAAMLFLRTSPVPAALFDVENAHIEAQFALESQDCKACGIGQKKTLFRCVMSPGQKKSYFVNGAEIDAARGRNFLMHHTVHINTSKLLLEHRRDVDAQIQSGDITIFFAQSAYQELYTQYPEMYAAFLAALHDMFPQITYRPNEKLFDNIAKLRESSALNFGAEIHEGDEVRTVANLGSGYLQLMVVLVFLFHPRYSFVIIDEPENHLHIGLQKKLLKIIKSFDTRKHIIISTHSPLFITPDDFDQLHRVVKNDRLQTQVFPVLEMHKRIDIQRLSQELNLESNEMLFADHVILVEGEADEILIRGLLDRFYIGKKEVLVLAVHSNTNFKIYRDVLRYFTIPYTIMTDRDSLQGYVDVIDEAIGSAKGMPFPEKLALLKKQRIYVLPEGALERHYPRTYQNRDDSKPINALRAAKNITPDELRSARMKPILEVLESVHGGG
ncbi:MAG: hypothetical protein A3F54_02980 [Candidatus Kerfeldbacteria bacterium RIFCSPHIGHO2_12_FULL_48_17]|uniref:AAA domain-containing protein n=1 Tax=Candidatus Kerfeldbacteria bacterium RIFCSPHIGHO2_12_FULL_48_17 TaxID=1798542 RepID=A0A1G2B851_9BACT|nr:MAG: hypothetical protein A3F54_02980 [Candidatus Kerfeldbacteria bacterium RIFCSPHIGHO2_12_FULL_48_17]